MNTTAPTAAPPSTFAPVTAESPQPNPVKNAPSLLINSQRPAVPSIAGATSMDHPDYGAHETLPEADPAETIKTMEGQAKENQKAFDTLQKDSESEREQFEKERKGFESAQYKTLSARLSKSATSTMWTSGVNNPNNPAGWTDPNRFSQADLGIPQSTLIDAKKHPTMASLYNFFRPILLGPLFRERYAGLFPNLGDKPWSPMQQRMLSGPDYNNRLEQMLAGLGNTANSAGQILGGKAPPSDLFRPPATGGVTS